MAHFYILRPHTKLIEPDYLCWALNQSWIVEKYVQKYLVGSVLPFVTKESLLKFKLPLPKMSTQKQIMSVLKLRVREKEIQDRIDQKKSMLINTTLRRLL